jgi:hypothetical protein
MNLTLFKILEFGNMKLSLGGCVQYQVEMERVLSGFTVRLILDLRAQLRSLLTSRPKKSTTSQKKVTFSFFTVLVKVKFSPWEVCLRPSPAGLSTRSCTVKLDDEK